VLFRIKHQFEEFIYLALSTTLAALAATLVATLAAALAATLVAALALSATPVSTPTFAASTTIFTISTSFTRHYTITQYFIS